MIYCAVAMIDTDELLKDAAREVHTGTTNNTVDALTFDVNSFVRGQRESNKMLVLACAAYNAGKRESDKVSPNA